MQEQPQQLPPVPPVEPGVQPIVPDTVVQPVSAAAELFPATSAAPIAPVDMVNPTEPIAQPAPVAIEWQASEYVTREKDTTWFILLGVVAVVLFVVALLVIKDITFALLVVVMAVAIVVFARRPARDMNYHLSYEGLSVNDKFFSFHNYRAFGVVQEGAIYSITMLPVKRFAPSVNVYFPPENGEQIVDVFGAVLPMEEVKQDFIDRLSEKLHF